MKATGGNKLKSGPNGTTQKETEGTGVETSKNRLIGGQKFQETATPVR